MGGGDGSGMREFQEPFEGAPEATHDRDSALGFAEQQRAQPDRISDDELYEMSNLAPRMTGLPMIVWVSPRGGARHDVRVKVALVHGSRLVRDGIAVVSLRPEPSIVAGDLDGKDFALVRQWISLNEAALLEYWEEKVDTGQLVDRLRRI